MAAITEPVPASPNQINEDILRVLKNPTLRDRAIIAQDVRQKALKCIEAMFHYAKK